MLDIKDIEDKLQSGEVVDLKCVDIDGLLGANKGAGNEWKSEVVKGIVRVAWVERSAGRIRIISSSDLGVFLLCEDLKYFRIKEDSPYIEDNPTFNDLIDVATQAWKDGYLRVLEFQRGAVEQIFTVIGEDALRWHEGDSDYSHAVDLINSLYTETFVIESLADIERIKLKDKLYQNGFEYEIDQSRLNNLQDCKLFLLKGATVTQKRGK